MEPDQIIERLGSDNPPTVEELSDAREALTEAQATIKANIRENKGTLAELRDLKTDLDQVTSSLSKVETALDEVQAERDAILAEVGDDPEDVEENGDEDTDEAEVDEPVAVAASLRQTLARIKPTPARIEVNEPDLSRVSTSYTVLGRDREEISPSEVGQAFADTSRRFGGSKTTVLSIKSELAPERTLTGDGSANERKMLDLFGANPVVPITAAGGCCSIPEPIYDQPMLGDLSRPIRNAFDVLNASRGAVQAYPPICIPDEGADVWTCAQDEAVDDEDPLTWKTCVALECDTEAATLVEPIYKCLTVGTFQERFAPEQWEAFVFQVDKLAARLAEARLFNWLAAAATAVYTSPVDSGSTYANFIQQQIRIAATIRQEQRLGDAQIVTVGSNLIYSAIAEDTLTRRLNTVDNSVEFFKDKVDSVLREFGITYVGSDDVAAMGDPLSYDGTFPAYPDELPMVTLPAGSAKVLDGGEKNLGVDVVDFDLARQNRVGAFSEFWEGLLVRNCAVVFSTVEVDECALGCPPVEA